MHCLAGRQQILGDGQLFDQRRKLEGAVEPGLCPAVRGPAVDVDTFELDVTAVRLEEARNDVDARRLSGTVVPDQTDNLAPSQHEADIPERLQSTELFADAINTQDRFAAAELCRFLRRD